MKSNRQKRNKSAVRVVWDGNQKYHTAINARTTMLGIMSAAAGCWGEGSSGRGGPYECIISWGYQA